MNSIDTMTKKSKVVKFLSDRTMRFVAECTARQMMPEGVYCPFNYTRLDSNRLAVTVFIPSCTP